MRTPRPHAPLALSAVALLLLSACAGTDSTPAEASPGSRPVVVTDIYPTTYAVQQVAGDAVEIVQLAPAGVEPHDYELTPQQVQQIADAALVAYVPGMIPAVQTAVAQEAADRSVDVTEGIARLEGHAEDDPEHEESGDPHVWLDPVNMGQMGRTVARALTDAGVQVDASGIETEMADLDAELGSALASCTIETMVVSHEAFGYLAQAYGFTQVGIAGLSPEAEPSPAKMAEIIDLVRSEGITTIYFEGLVSPAAAEAIAAETGTTTALLDPIEGNTDDRGYPSLMRANKDALKTGQSCS